MCNLLVQITQNGQNRSCDTIALKGRNNVSKLMKEAKKLNTEEKQLEMQLQTVYI